ncbi:Hypothetical predicted protein [Podarcis lilfordi]|uniref:UPAR/Ly6 domain-containing protein n=1 Tax=Podarcis lilfordi TaxID=74358 RepID=A0AA35PD86_9SAUR|nr:Hypothetical predicted protein [Podarcis lilfordi]
MTSRQKDIANNFSRISYPFSPHFFSGISALKCYQSNFIISTPLTTSFDDIINCSSAENVCTEAQLTLRIDKEVLIMSHKGCASKDLVDGTKPINSGDRHFAILFNQIYCFGDLCNANSETWIAPKTPIKDTAAEGSSSNQCHSGFDWGLDDTVHRIVTCSKGYNQCYSGTYNISVATFLTPMIFRTCQRPACDAIKSQIFGPISITSKSGSCCSSSNCNGKIINPTNYGVRSTTNPYLSYDHYGSGFQGLCLQLCPLLAVLGTTILGIWG